MADGGVTPLDVRSVLSLCLPLRRTLSFLIHDDVSKRHDCRQLPSEYQHLMRGVGSRDGTGRILFLQKKQNKDGQVFPKSMMRRVHPRCSTARVDGKRNSSCAGDPAVYRNPVMSPSTGQFSDRLHRGICHRVREIDPLRRLSREDPIIVYPVRIVSDAPPRQ